jgi:hypothetical protein
MMQQQQYHQQSNSGASTPSIGIQNTTGAGSKQKGVSPSTVPPQTDVQQNTNNYGYNPYTHREQWQYPQNPSQGWGGVQPMTFPNQNQAPAQQYQQQPGRSNGSYSPHGQGGGQQGSQPFSRGTGGMFRICTYLSLSEGSRNIHIYIYFCIY